MKITQADLLDALKDALQRPGDGEGQPVQELAVAMGCGDEKVRTLLKRIASDGRLEVSKVRRPALDGRIMLVPAYRIKP